MMSRLYCLEKWTEAAYTTQLLNINLGEDGILEDPAKMESSRTA
jgi:hypothetical protein